jgi:hypothetical protein
MSKTCDFILLYFILPQVALVEEKIIHPVPVYPRLDVPNHLDWTRWNMIRRERYSQWFA